MRDSFELRNPDNFVAGVVGEPGERIFFLQASEENLVVTMKVEKGQVQSLASYLADVLDDQSEKPAASSISNMVEPPNAIWTVGALAIAVEENTKALVVIIQELVDNEQDKPAETHIHLTPSQAKAFIDHALFLIEFGRDFGRQNGHKPIGE